MTGPPSTRRSIAFDPTPYGTLDALYDRDPRVAAALDQAVDWIESDPPDSRAKRRRFTNGMWAITVRAAGQEWVILWEEPAPNAPVVRHIGEATSI